MIRVNQLTKQVGIGTPLKNISFQIKEQESVGIFGASGAGKTMLCDVLSGFLSCGQNTVYIDGQDIEKKPAYTRGLIGYVPAKAPLYLDMTVSEYLEFMCGINRLARRHRKQRISSALYTAGLTAHRHAEIKTLSLLNRRRTALAGAIVYGPKILILDQFFTGLTTEDTLVLRTVLQELRQDYTFLLCSDTAGDIVELCNRVLVLNEGVMTTDTSIARLLSFSSQRNRLRLRIAGHPPEIKAAFSPIYEIVDITFQNVSEQGLVDVFIDVAQDVDLRQQIWMTATNANLPILEMRNIQISPEDIFMQLTSHGQGGN